MASTSSILEVMNNITLEDEEDEGLAFQGGEGVEQIDGQGEFNTELCLVGRFLSEGVVDFPLMQQTMAALWRPGKGVYIKEVDVNLYVFQFYHEVDIKRVMEGSPWSFNRKALIFATMKEGDIPRAVSLNTMDLWVQIHDLRAGFMSENAVREVGNYIGKYVDSCSSNFTGVWREYLRVRVTMDLSKPLKRRMKIRKSGNDWYWIIFKYENIPTFCFICGMLGHADKYCSRLFDTPENEITRPFGTWMRAPLRKPARLIGAKWIRDGNGGRSSVTGGDWNSNGEASYPPQNQEKDKGREIQGDQLVTPIITELTGTKSAALKGGGIKSGNNQSFISQRGVAIIDNKKRRTGDEGDNMMDVNKNTEMDLGPEESEAVNMEQDLHKSPVQLQEPKNVKKAGLLKGVCQGL